MMGDDQEDDDPRQGIPISSETKRQPADESERSKDIRKDDDHSRDKDD